MTQRSNFPHTIQATPTGVQESLRVALGLAPVVVLVLITLITVQLGAGFGYV